MVMKCSTVCLVALSLLGSLCYAQWLSKPSKPGDPIKTYPPRDPQEKQTFEKPIKWTYPADPLPVPQLELPFVPIIPVSATSVAVQCREAEALVEVKRDLFGNGQLINPSDITLGGCPVTGGDSVAQVLFFEYELSECDSSLALTEDAVIYTFTLIYNPTSQPGAPVVRTCRATVIVECHYQRKQDVSSLPLQPSWIPFFAVRVVEEFLDFTLRLMTDDFQFTRPSNQYFLGEIVKIEATVQQYEHTPLRIFVDNCVATLSQDTTSLPRYAFIENNGCMLDARITDSTSMFLRRTDENKLKFQMEAFKFDNVESGLIFITCRLKAVTTASGFNNEQRACSYVNEMWVEASGVNDVCESCESGALPAVGPVLSTPGRKLRDVSQKPVESNKWEGAVTLGPIHIKERPQ